jgi:hypothetical protein
VDAATVRQAADEARFVPSPPGGSCVCCRLFAET